MISSIASKIPLNIGNIHIIGIGGIGMSGIADILNNLGYKVQGSDAAKSANTERLEKSGIKVYIGQSEENLKNVAVVVKSSAIKNDNPEIIAARKNKIPVIKRAEMLAELMRLKLCVSIAGTHGKTTTTSITAAIFEAQKLQPTIINGGILNAHGTNAILGKGEWLVVEADESDGTFIKIPSTVGIITNIDPEHMEHYGSFDNLKQAFTTFIENLPFYGFGVLCADHPVVHEIAEKITDRKILTYALNTNADARAFNIRSEKGVSTFDAEFSDNFRTGKKVIKNITLPMPGIHNVSNALATIAVAVELGFDEENIKSGLAGFKGVKRRFTKTGEVDGITIIDDYGHHPKEIEATLKTARSVVGKDKNVIAVVQPHRYSRVNDLFEDFCKCYDDADKVIITDIYEAGEKPITGINRDSLVEGIKKAGHSCVMPLQSKEQLPELIKDIARNGDIVVCLGAGSISAWANELPLQLQKMAA